MQSVVIIDYGSGNLHSAAKAFERANLESGANARILVTSDPALVLKADRIVLPGVGAFADCKRGLEAVPGLRDALEQRVRRGAVPFLGICVGMQLMAKCGHEFQVTEGLGWIDGEVRAIAPSDPSLKIPHMGWNTLEAVREHALLGGIPTGANGLHAYFVHSFHMVVGTRDQVIAETDYGGPLTAIVGDGNIVGTQFHPEKSQTLGLRFIANFLNWIP